MADGTPRAPEDSSAVPGFRLRRPSIATQRISPDMWLVYHLTEENVLFGRIDKASTGWRAFDVKGRELAGHRLMTRTQAAQTVADAYAARARSHR